MAKRKVIVEGTVTYYVLTPEGEPQYHRGAVYLAREFKVTVDLKSKKNAGGEAWDWAQKNWPDFVGEEGPEVIIEGVTYQTEVHWFAIGGVTNLKGSYLPIEIEGTSYPRSATPKGCKAIDKRKKTKGKAPKKPATRTKRPKAKTANKPAQSPELPEIDSMEDYKAQQIQKVLEADDG